MEAKCNLCGTKVKKRVISDMMFEYSFARFVEQYFYNSRCKTPKGQQCPHCPIRDYTRWFHMKDRSVVRFKFVKGDIYTVDLLNIR